MYTPEYKCRTHRTPSCTRVEVRASMNLHPTHALLLLSVLQLVLTVCGAPQGPPSIHHIAVEVNRQKEVYIPWVDRDKQVCVFQHYTLPWAACLQLYGQETVASWPIRNLNPGVLHGIPGANIG